MNDDLDVTQMNAAKSDQLNAVDLVAASITVKITDAKPGSKDQPLILVIDGGMQPYKPSKTARRLMAIAWGPKAKAYVGKSMTLYCDGSVTWAGKACGGIMPSHFSHIDQGFTAPLPLNGKAKKDWTIKKLNIDVEPTIRKGIVERFMGLVCPDARGRAWEMCNDLERLAINTAIEAQS